MINSKKGNIKIWLIPFNLSKLDNSNEEILLVKNFPKNYANRFLYSRAYIRLALSNFFSIPPHKVPLYSFPQSAPTLKKGFGYISLSHCNDMMLMVWSDKKIGVDIERIDRKVKHDLIIKRFFKNYENIYFKDFENKNKKFLDLWVIYESLIKYEGKNLFVNKNNWFINLEENKAVNLFNNNEIDIITLNYKFWVIGIANIFIENSHNPIICVY